MSMNVGDSGGEGEPMVEMNTTPLIDVLLVLLVMLIITIPIQTHAVKLDMPPPNPHRPWLSTSRRWHDMQRRSKVFDTPAIRSIAPNSTA